LVRAVVLPAGPKFRELEGLYKWTNVAEMGDLEAKIDAFGVATYVLAAVSLKRPIQNRTRKI
jgi:hypothetical protein